jgi:Chromo (CHRromatin Organisation MOdifier) domain
MLPLLTLVHNNNKNSTTGYSLNQLLIGADSEIMPTIAIGSDNPSAESQVERLCQWRQMAAHALNRQAQIHQPLALFFRVGQKVWLEARNLALPYRSIKLAPQHHGPFTITGEISPVVYKLELPPSWNIHPMFHASLLTPYVKTKEHSKNFTQPPPDIIDGKEEYEVKAIRSHRHHRRRKQLQYLIKWKGYPKSDNTWEPATEVHAPLAAKDYHHHHPLATINKGGLIPRSQHPQSFWLPRPHLPTTPGPTTRWPSTGPYHLPPETWMMTLSRHPHLPLRRRNAVHTTNA